MKIKFIWVGKTKDRNWKALQEEYLTRLSHFAKYEIVEIRDSDMESEGAKIIESFSKNGLNCVLEPIAKQLGSEQLAEKIEHLQNLGTKEIAFIIGGADGLSREVVKKADFGLSLSLLTLTHEAARVVLIEQIYRAYTIIKGYPYQK
jgi:23S rRNA (pseudouridine1915-N3)-methyltransferase